MAAGSAAMMAGMAAMSASQTVSQAKAQKEAGNYQSRVGQINASFARLAKEDALARGDKAAKNAKKEAGKIVGAQRAALAGQGIDADFGTAAQLQEETAAIGAEEELTIRNNAWREAWGFETQAMNATAAGTFAQIQSRADAANTISTGMMRTADYGLQSSRYYKEWRRNKNSGGST